MNPPVDPSTEITREIREPKSTLYVFGSAVLAALILGLTIFLLVRGFQWRAALADLRAEPGIEILSIERVGFFKKRLLGLRDPLAPSADSILRKHNIGANTAEVILTEYHSLNTPYAIEREKLEQSRLNELREAVLTAVGEFAKTTTAKREEDLEKITRMLFQARFPEAMKTVDLEWKTGNWLVKGELYGPHHEAFVKESPAYIVEGDLNFDQLVNLTESRTSSIRRDIEATDLFTVDLDGLYVHIDRMRRLVADYDGVCAKSGLSLPKLQLEISVADLGSVADRIAAIRKGLTGPGGIAGDRFLLDLAREAPAGQSPKAFLKLVPVPAP
mgnify:CR=1 FL=1